MIVMQASSLIYFDYRCLNVTPEGMKEFALIWGPLLWIKLAVDFILNAYILLLFCSKLYRLSVIRTSKQAKKSFSTQHSKQIFEVMVKFFLLTFLTVLSTQLKTGVNIFGKYAIQHAVDHDEYTLYKWAYFLSKIFATVDRLVSAGYVLLTFTFTQSVYDKCCSCPHTQCVKLWTKSIEDPFDLDRIATTTDTSIQNKPAVQVPNDTPASCTDVSFGDIEIVTRPSNWETMPSNNTTLANNTSSQISEPSSPSFV